MKHDEIKQKALAYYPMLWNKERIHTLVVNSKLTAEDYKEITGEEFAEKG